MRGVLVVSALAAACRGGFDALSDGGGTDDSPVTIARLETSLSAGQDHTCAIVDAALYCWGRNQAGQVGIGTVTSMELSPRRIPGQWREVAAGTTHTCAIAIDDTVWCWGTDSPYGQLGIAGDHPSPVQLPIATSPAPTHIETMTNHTCLLRSDQTLLCWGRNDEGEIGIEDGGNIMPVIGTPTAPMVSTGFDDVAAGQGHTIGLRGGAAWGTGRNSYGDLGLPTTTTQVRTFVSGPGGTYTQVAAGQDTTIVIAASDGALYGWGANVNYELGTASLGMAKPLMLIDGAHQWKDVDVDCFGGAGIVDDGDVMCWGRNDEGQCGTSTPTLYMSPAATVPFGDAIRVSYSRFHACVMRIDKTVWCTGANDFGMVGDGTTTRPYAWTHITLP